jgi:hypothetical protein
MVKPIAEELLVALNKPNPTIETLEAAVDFLAAHRFTVISERLFRLADLVRKRMNRD